MHLCIPPYQSPIVPLAHQPSRTRTKYPKREPSPHRALIRRQLRRLRRVRLVRIQYHTKILRGALQPRIEHDRADRQPERRAQLRERLEQCPPNTLLVREADARDEERAGAEDEIRPEDAYDGCGEAERPVRRGGDDDGEEEVRGACEERPDDCVHAATSISEYGTRRK